MKKQTSAGDAYDDGNNYLADSNISEEFKQSHHGTNIFSFGNITPEFYEQ